MAIYGANRLDNSGAFGPAGFLQQGVAYRTAQGMGGVRMNAMPDILRANPDMFSPPRGLGNAGLGVISAPGSGRVHNWPIFTPNGYIESSIADYAPWSGSDPDLMSYWPVPSGTMAGLADVTIGDTTIDQATITGANAELNYLTNWWRGINGQPPLTGPAAAPTVNFGLDPATQNMVLIGGIALVALMALKKRGGGTSTRRRRRRR